MLKNFRTYQLSVDFYRALQGEQLPCHLRDQLFRAASSVCLNLAEGYGRRQTRDKCRFYTIAFGSLREVEAILDISGLSQKHSSQLDIVAAHLYKLIAKLRASS